MKKVFQILVAFIVIAAIGGLVLSFTIDEMVKSNLESTTSQMLQTSVEVEDVSISILDGMGSIDGITIHNPDGFNSDQPAMRLKQIKMKIDVYSLLSDTVIVKSIEIRQPELFFEQKLSGSNLNALIKKPGASSSETNLVVDYLLVHDGTVTLSTDIGGEKSAKATFERFELKGIGRKGNNTVEQTLTQILEPMAQKAVREAVKKGLLEKVKDEAKDLFDG